MISRLQSSDQARWVELWEAYLDFYQTPLPTVVFERTWSRLQSESGDLRTFGIWSDETPPRLVGIVHYLFHPSAWTTADVCYLQDLYVDPAYRGRGYARSLIEAVCDAAREHGSDKVYWSTQESNVTARRLYDSVARFTGFIRYDRIIVR